MRTPNLSVTNETVVGCVSDFAAPDSAQAGVSLTLDDMRRFATELPGQPLMFEHNHAMHGKQPLSVGTVQRSWVDEAEETLNVACVLPANELGVKIKKEIDEHRLTGFSLGLTFIKQRAPDGQESFEKKLGEVSLVAQPEFSNARIKSIHTTYAFSSRKISDETRELIGEIEGAIRAQNESAKPETNRQSDNTAGTVSRTIRTYTEMSVDPNASSSSPSSSTTPQQPSAPPMAINPAELMRQQDQKEFEEFMAFKHKRKRADDAAEARQESATKYAEMLAENKRLREQAERQEEAARATEKQAREQERRDFEARIQRAEQAAADATKRADTAAAEAAKKKALAVPASSTSMDTDQFEMNEDMEAQLGQVLESKKDVKDMVEQLTPLRSDADRRAMELVDVTKQFNDGLVENNKKDEAIKTKQDSELAYQKAARDALKKITEEILRGYTTVRSPVPEAVRSSLSSIQAEDMVYPRHVTVASSLYDACTNACEQRLNGSLRLNQFKRMLRDKEEQNNALNIRLREKELSKQAKSAIVGADPKNRASDMAVDAPAAPPSSTTTTDEPAAAAPKNPYEALGIPISTQSSAAPAQHQPSGAKSFFIGQDGHMHPNLPLEKQNYMQATGMPYDFADPQVPASQVAAQKGLKHAFRQQRKYRYASEYPGIPRDSHVSQLNGAFHIGDPQMVEKILATPDSIPATGRSLQVSPHEVGVVDTTARSWQKANELLSVLPTSNYKVPIKQ